VKVRIIAATNSDLQASLGKTFRQDLYYRLNVIQIHMPPLRERQQDIPELCGHLLKTIAPGRSLELPPDEIARLKAYSWPGNVRELRNVLERAVLVNRDGQVRPSSFLDQSRPTPEPERREAASPAPPADGAVTLASIEERSIRDALQTCNGNLTHAAQALGISRSTLKRRLKEYRAR
jgi:DNA-binding NtrC family response regulator